MLNFLSTILTIKSFIPHGHCYLWNTELVWLHITADAFIALAYYSIPIALFYFVCQRKDLPFKWVFLLFGAFIISCGTTHLLEIWTLWYPNYWFAGSIKAITALISVFTAIELVPLLPKALAIPNPTQLQQLNEELQISQARLAGIVDIAGDAVISVDSNQQIALFNRAAEQVFGYTVAEALGQPLDLLLPQRFVAAHHQHVSHFKQQSGNTRRMGDRGEVFGRRKDGTEFPAEASISKLEVQSESILTVFLRDISERKQAVAELQEQQQFLRQVIDSNPNLIFVKDWQGQFTLANQALAQLYNTTVEAIIGKTDADFSFNLAEAEQYMQADRQVMQTLQPLLNLEESFTTATGTVRYFQSTKKPLASANGEMRYVLGVATDITTLKQTEAALHQKSEEIEVFFRSTIDLLCIANTEGYFLRLNPEWEQTLGYQLQDLEGKCCLDFVHPDDLQTTLTVLSELSEQQSVLSFINRYRHQDGSYRWLEWRSFPRENYIYAAARDITDRKQAEAALRESEERFRGAFDYSAIGMALIGLDGRWLKVNPAICEIVGYSEEALISLTFQDITHPDDLETDLAYVQQLLAGEIRTYQMEKRYFHRQGQIVWVLLNVSIVCNSQNQPLYFISQIQDITDRKQAEEKLCQSENTKRAMLQAIPDLLIRMRDDGTQLDLINQGCVHFMGSEYTFIGSNIADVLPLDVAHERLHYAEQALQTGEVLFHEYQLTIDGEHYYEEARIVPLQANEVLMMVRDISDRKRMEQALRESETRFRTLLRDLHVGVVVYGIHSESLLCNSKALELLDLTEAQFLGKTPFDLDWNVIHEDGSPFTGRMHPVPQAIATGCSVHNVIMGVYRTQRNDRVWLLVDAEPQLDPAGNVQQVICTFSDISDRQAALREREHAKAELQKREQEFRALVENAPDIIMRLDCNCRYLYINPTVERHSGIPAATFINKTIEEFGAPQALVDLWQTKIHETFATGQEQRLEFETSTDTGIVYYATRVVPEFANNGSVQSVLAIARDISDYVRILQERERAEEQLRQSEARLRLALKAAKFGTWEYNFTTDQLFQNDISEIYGLQAGQTHNTLEEWQAQIHPDDRSWVRAEFDRAIQAAGEFSIECRIIRLDGMVRWALSTGAVVQNQAGQPLYAYGILADITDRKLAEVEQTAQQAFLRQVIDVVPNIIFVKDKEGRILIVNQAGATMHGSTVEAMVGKREIDFNPNFNVEQLEEFLAINRQVMQTRQSYTNLTQSVVSATGKICWYQTVINPLIDVDGQVTGIIGATTNVTTLKHAEQALQQAKEAAEAANNAKSVFLANMSHEFRTPLNVILGFVQAMQRDRELTLEQQENLQIIRRSGDHLLSLIDDVLDLSKIEAGHSTLDENNVDLIDLLQSLEQMFRQRAAAKGLQLRLELGANLPQYVTIDANKLRQVLINLLGNAIKFTKQGQVTLQVETISPADDRAEGANDDSSTLNQSFIRFEVNDTGVGINPTELETIFNAFVQTQAGKVSPDGTGLGLTISRKFVQMMGGDITVQSIPEQGSTFTFTLAVNVVRSTVASMTPGIRVISLAPNQPRYRILVADDQPENRTLLVKLLTQLGLEVREAANGQEAITQWQHWQPDLIYMDIRMPLLNGHEATRQIRAIPNGQTPIIIALTAQASESDRTLALVSGCNDYLSKPFREEMLLSKMAEHLGLQYLYDMDYQPNTFDKAPLYPLETLHPADLSVMPSDWITALRRAAQLCDDSQIQCLIEQIPVEQTSLIQGLRQLMQSYSFKQIVVLASSGSTDGHA